MKARERGAKIIHVDPHFSRTSAVADLYVPIRAGSDIAFLGGLIRHIIETESYFKDYVVHYTNASMILHEDFKDTEDLDGLFSGFDPETGIYDRTSWMFEGGDPDKPASDEVHSTQAFTDRTEAGTDPAKIPRDPTLQHPRCVFQVLKRHYSRYTPEMVERVCGTPKELFLEVAETLIANSGRERTTMLAYAVGWTQHTAGVQMIRAGRDRAAPARQRRPAGRRHHGDARPRLDPGLERHPDAVRDPPGLPADAARDRGRPDAGRLRRRERPQEGLVVALRQLHRLAAQGLVRRGRHRRERLRLRSPAEADRQPLALPDDAARARRRARRAVRDGPEPGGRVDPLRAAAARARRAQVARGARPGRPRDGALLARLAGDPLGRAAHRGHRDRGVPDAGRRARREGGPLHEHPAAAAVARQGDRPAGRRALGAALRRPPRAGGSRRTTPTRTAIATGRSGTSRGTTRCTGRTPSPRPRRCSRRSTATTSQTGELLDGFAQLKADGTTASGCWIYCGCFAGGVNQTRRRDPGDLEAPGGWVSPDWGWAWPANRRILYNRASADPTAGRGPSASATSGGTRTRRSGRATTCPTSRPPSGPTTSRPRTPSAWTRSPATARSS